jgi:hypothetical protein
MADWSRETPWRQGHLLTVEAAWALGLRHPSAPEQTLVIVATHDCDLAQLPDGEPSVEVLVGRIVDKADGNFTHAKVPRRLHLAFEGGAPCLAEFEAISKVNIPKETLGGFAPRTETYLSPESASTFQLWLASRYRRSAFPDEFERRLKDQKLAEKISKALKPHGELISGVFFDVDEGRELARNGPQDPYTLDVYIQSNRTSTALKRPLKRWPKSSRQRSSSGSSSQARRGSSSSFERAKWLLNPF